MIHAYDTEFIEHHVRAWPFGRKVHTIELISIGIVAADGRVYYAVNGDAPWWDIKRDGWLMDNVAPSLPHGRGDRRNHVPKSWPVDFFDPLVKSHKKIAREVREFLLADGQPQLWADYGAYDHVVLCQLWGRMIDLPEGLPMFTRDLQQAADGRELPEQAAGAHNALEDARHVMASLRHLGIAGTKEAA